MPALNVAILGAGIFAKEAHLPAIKALGDAVHVNAVYSRSEKSAAAFAADVQTALGLATLPDVYHDGGAPSVALAALLARPDISAVIVVLPITTQPAIILQALAAGKHVLSEKPVAPDVAGAHALIREYEATYKPRGLVWRVAENFEYETAYRAAGQAIAEGRIGRVAFYNARVVNYIDKNSKWYNTPWRTVPDYQGGFLLDGGVHTLAALRIILLSPIKRVSAFASLTKDYLPPHDTINAVVQSADGTHGLIELTWGAPVASRSRAAGNGITVTGTEGWVAVEQVDGKYSVVVRRVRKDADGKEVGESEEVLDVPESPNGIQLEIDGFVKAIEGVDDGYGTPRGALRDVAFIQAALTSNGAPVDLDSL